MPKQTAQDIINQLAYRDTPYEEEEDPDFAEVEQRFQTAQYYKLLLKESLFSDDSAAAQQVEGELRQFIRTRIKVLLGLEGVRVNVVERDPVFSADEILALKELASRLLGGAYAPEPAKAPSGPVEQSKGETPPQTPPATPKRPGPKPGAKYAPRKPSLRKVEVPQELQDTNAAPAVKPQAKSTAKSSKATDTSAIEELGTNPKNNARRVKQNGRILEEAIDPEDGAVLLNDEGMVIWKDITPPAAPGDGFIPMPANNAFEALGMQDAMATQQRLTDPKNQLADVVAGLLR